MKRNNFYTTLILILLTSCNQGQQCFGIKNNQYSGYAVVFYHKSMIKNSCELFIIPVCGDSLKLKDKVYSNISKLQFRRGVSYFATNSLDQNFKTVFEKAHKIILSNNDDFDESYHSVYVSPVYIEFKNAKNYTRKITSSNEDFFKEKFIFTDGRKLIIDYFLTIDLQIDKIRNLE